MRTMVAMESGGRQLDYPAGTTQQRQSRSLRMLIFDPCSDRGGRRQRRPAMEGFAKDCGFWPLVVISRLWGPCTGICSDPASFSAVIMTLTDKVHTHCCYTQRPQWPMYSRRLRRSSPAQHGVHGGQCTAILGQHTSLIASLIDSATNGLTFRIAD